MRIAMFRVRGQGLILYLRAKLSQLYLASFLKIKEKLLLNYWIIFISRVTAEL